MLSNKSCNRNANRENQRKRIKYQSDIKNNALREKSLFEINVRFYPGSRNFLQQMENLGFKLKKNSLNIEKTNE
jgi:hypothetical protein